MVSPIREPHAYDITLAHRSGSQAEWSAWTQRPDVKQWLDASERLEAAITDVKALSRTAQERLLVAALDDAFGTEQFQVSAYGEPGAEHYSLEPQYPLRAPNGARATLVSVTTVGPVPLPRPETPGRTHSEAAPPLTERAVGADQAVRAASFPQQLPSAPTPAATVLPTGRAYPSARASKELSR